MRSPEEIARAGVFLVQMANEAKKTGDVIPRQVAQKGASILAWVMGEENSFADLLRRQKVI